MAGKRHNYTREFKLAILAQIDTGLSVAQVVRENGLHPTLVSRWKRRIQGESGRSFSGTWTPVRGPGQISRDGVIGWKALCWEWVSEKKRWDKRNLDFRRRKRNPYDNAHVESFFKTRKYEEVPLNEYDSFDDAMENIGRFIDEVYNEKRMHSSFGYSSPIQFEREGKLFTIA